MRLAPKLLNCRVNMTYFAKNHEILFSYFEKNEEQILWKHNVVAIVKLVAHILLCGMKSVVNNYRYLL